MNFGFIGLCLVLQVVAVLLPRRRLSLSPSH